MTMYELITCADVITAIKEVCYVTNVRENRREYVVKISVWGFPLYVHVYKDNPNDWRVTGFDPTGDGWDEMLVAVHAINAELDRHFY